MSEPRRTARLGHARDAIVAANTEAAVAAQGAVHDVARAIAVARTHLDTARLWLVEAERLEELSEKAASR